MNFFSNIIEQFKNPELLMILGGIVIALILLRVFKNFLDRHRILRIFVVGIILVGLLLGVWWFIDNRKDFYSDSVNTYVYGEVVNISSAVRKVELKVTRSNVKNKAGKLITDNNIIVDIDMNCKFLDNKGKEIKFSDIGFYDTVQIYTKQGTINDISRDTLSGVKVILKSRHSK